VSATVLVGAPPELVAQAQQAVRDWPGVELQVLAPASVPSGSELLARTGSRGPVDVVVLGPDMATGAALALARELAATQPAPSVVMVGTLDADSLLEALRAGVQDVLAPGADTAVLREALERAGSRSVQQRSSAGPVPARRRSDAPRPRVITVVSPKGGVGKTTVSTNLAVGLGQLEPGSTLIVDLDVQFGDVASAMQLTPESSVLDAVGSSGADSMVLKTFLTPHPSGLYALCAPEHPAGADRISGEDVAALLKKLTRQFRYVVVDTSAGLTEHTLGALEHTTDLLLLCGMDVPSVRAMRKELDILDELGLTGPTRSVLLNYVDSHSGLTVKDVEGMLGCAVDIELPRSREVPISTNRGVPLLVAGSRDAAAKELAKLVSRYAPPTTERPQRRVRHLLGAR
jgi:pilus assembly protein CpaE